MTVKMDFLPRNFLGLEVRELRTLYVYIFGVFSEKNFFTCCYIKYQVSLSNTSNLQTDLFDP